MSWTTNAHILSKNTCVITILLFRSSHPTSILNEAENAIVTFRDRFLAGMCSVHPNFPMHLWYCLILLATTTLNLLRPLRIKPNLLFEALLNGAFNYNKTLLAPPGTKVLRHETPEKRGTSVPHGVDG